MKIQEAVPEDSPALARVHVDSWRSTYRGIVPDEVLEGLSYERREVIWRSQLAEAGGAGFTYLAEGGDGEILGFASGGPERSGDPDYRGEVYGIYLLEQHQGHGIGRRLFQRAAARLAGAGITSLLVWVLASSRSRGFYEALGGERVREDTIEMYGGTHVKVSYGWKDTRSILLVGDQAE